MISGIANLEKADFVPDAVAVSLYLDFRPTKYPSLYPVPTRLKKLEPVAIMSDEEETDDEMTMEEEMRLRKLKEETKPIADLAFLLTQTKDYGMLLKKDRKRKEAKRQKQKQKSEDPMSSRAQGETAPPESNFNRESTSTTETVTRPLHVVSKPRIFLAVLSFLVLHN